MENTVQKQRKGGKLDDLWLGPYTIHKHLGKGIYQVANEAGKVLKKKVYINRLRQYVERCDGESPKRKRVKLEDPCRSEQESGEMEDSGCADLNLSKSDLDDIEQGRWLNDKVICAAQKLMKDDKELTATGGWFAESCSQPKACL